MSFQSQILENFVDQFGAELLAAAMHWELAPAFTTADRDMATSAPMRLKVASMAG
jgi:hypothetical protein